MFNNKDKLAGYSLMLLLEYGVSVDYVTASPVTVLHYLALASCLDDTYFELLKLVVDSGSIDFSASVDSNKKGVDQYVLALSMHKPNYKSKCCAVLDYLVSKGLSFTEDKNGVIVASGQSGGFNKHEFVGKYKSAHGGSSHTNITGMRQMNFGDDNYNNNDNKFDSDSMDGGQYVDNHANTLSIIASKFNLKTNDLKVRAIKSLLYEKVKTEYPDLKNVARTSKLEEFANSNIVDSFSDSTISKRMEIIATNDKNRPARDNKHQNKEESKPKKESKTKPKKSSKK